MTTQNSYFDRPALIHPCVPNAKFIVHKFSASYLQKPMPPLASTRTSACCLRVANRGKVFREDNWWTVRGIHNMLVKSEACKNLLGFQIDVLAVTAFFLALFFAK